MLVLCWKNDISKKYHVDPGKIDVAHNGANAIYRPLDEMEKTAVRKEYTSGCEYFVYVGALLPRKNVDRLLLAFDVFKDAVPSNIKMVIVGASMFNTQAIKKVYTSMAYKNDVIFTGRLAPGKIEKVLGSALALTYVSYYEGFGIPIVEAMKADVPVITSTVTSMPEVAGDAAILVDPFSVDSIKNALIEMYSNNKLRQTLIEKGRIQCRQFNWDKSAQQLWNSIEKCLAER